MIRASGKVHVNAYCSVVTAKLLVACIPDERVIEVRATHDLDTEEPICVALGIDNGSLAFSGEIHDDSVVTKSIISDFVAPPFQDFRGSEKACVLAITRQADPKAALINQCFDM